ncbi:hypothetical protein JDV02_010417 [Purpureocillium takamizusanense]|uniref:Uncharacterized protein n=1 Tax=Purpureocillium takamizusanense TaxID=2060973 RepID=A0A9Q8QSN5_9HYPO|nr:uncharacterized protein JDV02_010417 [Purpureocillium takamizusanense]UNI24687.1 hypothetical protein JDV02_010417 [Purpureocillium takamizusanense]
MRGCYPARQAGPRRKDQETLRMGGGSRRSLVRRGRQDGLGWDTSVCDDALPLSLCVWVSGWWLRVWKECRAVLCSWTAWPGLAGMCLDARARDAMLVLRHVARR